MTKIRVGVIGAGHLGKIHARLLLENPAFDLVAVCDPVASSRQIVEESLGVPAFADHHELAGQVDAVVIAAPTSMHHRLTLWALNSRLHCLVEKPLVPTADEAHELSLLAKRVDRKLQVGHVERFNPAWQVAHQHIGQPRWIECTRNSNYSGRSTDVGVVLDLMIHDLDLVLSLVPCDVARVDATGHAILGQHEDIAEARLEFEDGCVANLRASRASRQATRIMHVFSDQGMVDLDMGTATAEVVEFSPDVRSRSFQADQLPAAERLQVKDRLFTDYMPYRKLDVPGGNAIQAEHLDFSQAILERKDPQVTGDQATRVLAVAQSILQSIARQSRAVPSHYDAFPLRRAA